MTPDAVVVVPGIMGSELIDSRGRMVWGLQLSLVLRQRKLRNIINRLALTKPDDGMRVKGLLKVPSWLPMFDGIEPYTDLVRELETLVLRPDAVLTFPYDWRQSIEHNAGLLKAAATAHYRRWCETFTQLPERERAGRDPMITFVCHSMGGLVTRYFVDVLDTARATRRIITLGTPRLGSVKAARLLARGDVAPFGIGAQSLRDAARTMPGVYDLLPRFKSVMRGGKPDYAANADIVGLGGIPTLVEAAASRHKILTEAAANCEVRSLVGSMQPTLSSFSLDAGEAEFIEVKDGGDSTVPVSSALPAVGAPGGYLPQKHGRLARTKEAVMFVKAVLDEDEFRLLQAGEGAGLSVPAAAVAGRSFEIEVVSWDGGATISVEQAETGRTQTQLTPVKSDGRLVTSYTPPKAGLYRVLLTAGGYSDVAELVGVADPDEPA